MINYSINHVYLIKPQIKTPDTEAQGRFLFGECIQVGEEEDAHPVSIGTDALRSSSMYLFI